MIRENWRVALLVVLLTASLAALFVPFDGEGEPGKVQLEYGVQLDGGARIRAPLVGITAEDVNVSPNDVSSLEVAVADALGVDPIDVNARPPRRQGDEDQLVQRETGGTVEVFADVPHADLAAALREAGYDVGEDDVRDGVTKPTRERTVRVIENKINEAGLSGGSATTARSGDDVFVVVEAPNRDVAELRDLLSDRGVVRAVAYYPNETGTFVNETVLERKDFSSIGTAQQDRNGQWYVPVTVKPDAARDFVDAMQRGGLDSPPVNCRYDGRFSYTEVATVESNRCLMVVRDDRVVFAGGVQRDLANSFRTGDFVQNPSYRMTTQNQSEAQQLAVDLQAGALPTNLAFDRGTTFSLEPALADRFKTNSLLTGIIAVLVVSLVVYLRYGDPRVAFPMIVTALSEVLILLGGAALINFPLDLSIIAGFIAVIGTGVDDLVIIADGVMSEGEVRSERVFQSRFRKAFWVIGAAAATTIIAMLPLTVLSLGDLTGFAIVTIFGVLIGVFITRPAYGDILNALLTET
jgi:preprotein translocase subunit SecD